MQPSRQKQRAEPSKTQPAPRTQHWLPPTGTTFRLLRTSRGQRLRRSCDTYLLSRIQRPPLKLSEPRRVSHRSPTRASIEQPTEVDKQVPAGLHWDLLHSLKPGERLEHRALGVRPTDTGSPSVHVRPVSRTGLDTGTSRRDVLVHRSGTYRNFDSEIGFEVVICGGRCGKESSRV